jgi:hypothetical protein
VLHSRDALLAFARRRHFTARVLPRATAESSAMDAGSASAWRGRACSLRHSLVCVQFLPLRRAHFERYISSSKFGGSMRTRPVLWLLSAMIGLSCGSDPVPAADVHSAPPAAATSGNEAPIEPASIPEPQASGPASLLLRASVDGQNVPAHVRVLEAGGRVEAEGEAGTPIELHAGQYRGEITIDDASVLADRPTQVRELFLSPGKQTAVEASFPWSRIQLNVMVSGRSHPGVPVKLIRNDQPVAELKSGANPALISPGKYEADVLMSGTTIRVKGLLFPENGAQTVPVRVQF